MLQPCKLSHIIIMYDDIVTLHCYCYSLMILFIILFDIILFILYIFDIFMYNPTRGNTAFAWSVFSVLFVLPAFPPHNRFPAEVDYLVG